MEIKQPSTKIHQPQIAAGGARQRINLTLLQYSPAPAGFIFYKTNGEPTFLNTTQVSQCTGGQLGGTPRLVKHGSATGPLPLIRVAGLLILFWEVRIPMGIVSH